MRERPKTIQRLYEEFEKYCLSDNDFRMCMEEQSQQKKSAKASQPSEREWPNPRNTSHTNPRFVLDGENTQENPNPQADSQSLVPSPPSPPHSNQGEAAGAEEVEAGVGAEAEAEATTRKENGTAFSTRKMMTIAQTIAQIRKGSKLSSKKRGRKRRERVS
jgi:hypothetical protein